MTFNGHVLAVLPLGSAVLPAAMNSLESHRTMVRLLPQDISDVLLVFPSPLRISGLHDNCRSQPFEGERLGWEMRDLMRERSVL
jgi:hypothetical protein